ncbi:MAG TPA: hypothetical protein VFH51_15400, partial [Myxococcota bacterium]|nr:hypothetical protein [Myxococcota bacterium]
WLNTVFWTAWADTDGCRHRAARCLDATLRGFGEARTQALFEAVQAQRACAAAWHTRAAGFADPDAFVSLWDALGHDTNALMAQMQVTYDGSGRFGRLLQLRTACDFVEAADACIKGLAGSPAYADPFVKAERWLMMLEVYIDMTCAWLERCEVHLEDDSPQRIALFLRQGANTLRAKVGRAAHSRAATEALLRCSPEFQVACVVLGSGADARGIRPASLDDLFTATHQNALAALAVLNRVHGVEARSLPPAMRKVCDCVEGIVPPYETSGTLQPLTLRTAYPSVEVTYTLPLRDHGLQLRVAAELDPRQNVRRLQWGVALTGGNERMRRMDRIMTYAAAVSAVLGLRFASGEAPRFAARCMRFTWDLTEAQCADEALVSALARHIEAMTQMSFTYADGSDTRAPGAALAELVQLASPITPTFEAALPQLPDGFFATYPWLNGAFMAHFGGADRRRVARVTQALAAPADPYWGDASHDAVAVLE